MTDPDQWERDRARLWAEQRARLQGRPVPLGTPQFVMMDRNGPPEAMTCPFYLCAACGHPAYAAPYPGGEITPYVLWWRELPEGNRREFRQEGPFIVHRPYCDHALQAAMEKQLAKIGGEWVLLTEDFAVVARQLAHNATHPLAAENDPDGAEYVAPLPSTFRATQPRG